MDVKKVASIWRIMMNSHDIKMGGRLQCVFYINFKAFCMRFLMCNKLYLTIKWKKTRY